MISLQVEQLTKKFNAHLIFQDLSFEHSKGILGISGSNGSGKSTLLKCLAYLLRPNSGSIMWKQDGALKTQKELKKNLGYAAPYINLYAELSIIENLRFLIEARGNKVNPESLLELIENVQMLPLKNQLFGSLSTGQQQRVKLAAVMINDPEVIMMDEPGSNLDEKGHALVTDMIDKASSSGKLVFLASNDPSEIALCDSVVEL